MFPSSRVSAIFSPTPSSSPDHSNSVAASLSATDSVVGNWATRVAPQSEQVEKPSRYSVPQFGQNISEPPARGLRATNWRMTKLRAARLRSKKQRARRQAKRIFRLATRAGRGRRPALRDGAPARQLDGEKRARRNREGHVLSR